MNQTFTYEEALLGLTTLVAWADGENQNSEVDARVKMIFHENINPDVLEDFKAKYERIGSDANVYKLCIAALKSSSAETRSKACAWMYTVAMVASYGKEGDLDYIQDIWEGNKNNVDAEELIWINKARVDLGISLDQMKYEYEKLPQIQRV